VMFVWRKVMFPDEKVMFTTSQYTFQ
jgi:hypothetical protein